MLSNLVESEGEKKPKLFLSDEKEKNIFYPSFILLHGCPIKFLNNHQSFPLLLKTGLIPRSQIQHRKTQLSAALENHGVSSAQLL